MAGDWAAVVAALSVAHPEIGTGVPPLWVWLVWVAVRFDRLSGWAINKAVELM